MMPAQATSACAGPVETSLSAAETPSAPCQEMNFRTAFRCDPGRKGLPEGREEPKQAGGAASRRRAELNTLEEEVMMVNRERSNPGFEPSFQVIQPV